MLIVNGIVLAEQL